MEEQREQEAQDHPVGRVYVVCAYLGSRKAKKLITDIRRPLKKKNKVGLALSERETMIHLYLNDSYCTLSQWRAFAGGGGGELGRTGVVFPLKEYTHDVHAEPRHYLDSRT